RPGAIWALATAQELHSFGQGAIDAAALHLRKSSPKLSEGTQGGTGAFQIGALRHAGAEHFRRVDAIDKSHTATLFKGAEAAVIILTAQNEAGCLMKPLVGNPFCL